jgi:hypothetical protein
MAPLDSLNGQTGKQPTSGLRNIKRDWSGSQSQATTNSQASQPIEWPPSPERPPKHKIVKATGYDDRVARIQAVLESNRQTSQKALVSSSSVPQKRVSDPESYAPGPVAKKRVLPSSWDRGDNTKQEPRHASAPRPAATKSTFGSASIAPKPFVSPLPEDGVTTDVARIFLSNEQQQILKLVEAGNNVFFTGSAGM